MSMLGCTLCEFVGARDRQELGDHLANEHPEAWEMAVSVVALQLMGVGGDEGESKP